MLSLSLLADTTWYPVTFDSPLNTARGVFFWLTVVLAAVYAVLFLVLRYVYKSVLKREGAYGKYFGLGAVSYACIVGAVLLILTFMEDGIEALLFYPLLILLIAVAASGAVLFFKRNKLVYILCGCAVGAALIASLVCMGMLFASGDSLWNNWIVTDDESDVDYTKVDQIGLYLSAALLLAAIVAATFLLGKGEKKGFDAKSISYAGVAVAMSFALSYLRIVKMPQGGSITVASLLPLIIYSYMFGVKKGVFAGMIYGLLQAVQDPYILHPAQFLLDYPAAFACIGLAGAFAKCKKLDSLPQVQIALGGVTAGLARFICHYFSGVFAFGSFGGGQNAWLYSLIYQSGYVLPDIAIVIAVGIIVFSSKAFVKTARKYHPKEKPAETTAAAEGGITPAA